MGFVYRQTGRRIFLMKYLGADGREIVETTGTEDRTAAKQVLRDRETAIHRGAQIVTGVGKLTFDDGATLIKADYQANRRRSARELETRLRLHLTPAFGGRSMASITTGDLRIYTKARLAAGAAAAQVSNELAVLKRMFNLAIQDGRLIQKPYFPMPVLHNARTGFFEFEMLEAVCAALPAAEADIATFAYYTGWRVDSEVLPLTWAQVDLRVGTVRLEVGTTKNDGGRLFPIGVHPALRTLLQRREKARPAGCPWVFWRPNGKRLSNISLAWKTAVESTPWPHLIPHDFRRTAVRNLTRAGVPERVAMQLTGHKTRSVFDRYNIVNEADLQHAVAQYARVTAAPARVLRGGQFREKG